MASRDEDADSTCLVCFETRPLKIVGNCRHRFCVECLSTVLESLASGSEVFACPSCKVDCPRPWNSVLGLVDFTRDEADDEIGDAPEAVSEIIEEKSPEQDKAWHVIETKCKICRHKKKDVLAINLCVECGNFYFCQECTDVHAKNKATQHHVVTPLYPEDKEDVAMCHEHDTALTSYCITCGTAVCTMCILMLDHGDHVIEDLGDIIRSKEAEVRNILEVQEKTLADMQHLEEDLTHLKVITPLVDKRDTLIKEIEDHAEKCMEQIVKWKEDLKKQVKADFKIIEDIPEGLVKVSKRICKLQKPITRANQLLTESKHQPVYLEKLVSMQGDLEALAKFGDDMHGEKLYGDKLTQLQRSHQRFIPAAMEPSLGTVEKATNINESHPFEPKEIFKCTMQVNSYNMFIPCVANLGKTFAVAHPTRKGEPSKAIDIYEFPGTLIKTLRENVPFVYDMCSTADGQLTVLSSGTGGRGCSVQLFDHETSKFSSTCDIDAGLPLSLGVTVQRQYVILGDKDGQRMITIADSNGAVKHKYDIRHNLVEVQRPKRITYGGRYIFVSMDENIRIYEIKDNKLETIQPHNELIITIKRWMKGEIKDISATACDDYIIAWTPPHAVKYLILVRYLHKQDKTYNCANVWTVSKNTTCREVRISERDGYIVLSHGRTIRVLEL